MEKRGLKPRELPLEEIPKGKVKDYLLASAACFPALRAKQIDGVQFLDGGYRDNMPTGLAQKMGAEELVCVDLEGVGITLPNRTGLPTTMVRSYWELGDILHFDPDTARRNIELGYYDTLRAFGRLRGCAYAVAKNEQTAQDAAAFRQRFDAVQKAVKAKYPVTLTADLALKLANMQDAELARWKRPLRMWAWTPPGITPWRRWQRRFWRPVTAPASRDLNRCSRAAETRRRPHGQRCCPIHSCRRWSSAH